MKRFCFSQKNSHIHYAGQQSANFLEVTSSLEEKNHHQEKRHFFEWWYMDIISNNGYHIVVIFHAPNYTFTFLEPITEVHVYNLNGEKIEQRWCVGKRRVIFKDEYGVAIDSNYFKGRYPHYELFLKNEDFELDLEFNSQIEGWKLGTGLLFRDNRDTGRCFNWVVPVPRATVSGKMKIGNKLIEVDGIGYHDHNWGNLVLRDFFSWWYWGRIFTDEYTLVYANIKKKSGNINPFMMARKGKIVVSTDKIETFQDYWTCRDTASGFPRQLTIKVTDGNEKIELTTKVYKILESTEYYFNPFQNLFPRKVLNAILSQSHFLSRIPFLGKTIKNDLGRSVYLRLLVNYDLTVNSKETFTGISIQEIMLLRPASK
jgi:hypothetical protein